MNFQGFQSNRTRYKRDCTVRALATVTGTSYEIVFETLKLAGRKDNSRFDIVGWMKSNQNRAFGCRFYPQSVDSEGTYLCWNNGHAWAVIDGVLHDSIPGSRRHHTSFLVVKDNLAPASEAEIKARNLAKLYLED